MTFADTDSDREYNFDKADRAPRLDPKIRSCTSDSISLDIPALTTSADKSLAAIAGLSADILQRNNGQSNLDILRKLSTPQNGTMESTKPLPDVWFCMAPVEPLPKDTKPLTSTREVGNGDENRIVHKEDGSKVEVWIVKKGNDGIVTSVKPQLIPDGKPDSQYLHEARESLVRQVESSKLGEGDKLRVYQKMQQMEQLVRREKIGGELPWSRADLAAHYQHATRLLLSGASIDQITSALTRPSTTTISYQSDSAGKFDENAQRTSDLKEKDRHHEFWTATMSSSKDAAIATFSLNGKEFEAWKFKITEGKVEQVESLLHPEQAGKDAQGLKEARLALVQVVHDSNMPEKAKLEFYRDLAHLEGRARSGDTGNDLLKTRTELAETYRHLGSLFDKSKQGKVPMEDRVILARQLAHQLADTMDIDQGTASDACRITVVEARLSVSRPSVVARIVKEAALDGTVNFGNPPVKVALDKDSLTPASPFATTFPRVQEERSFASQIFQLSCMNLLGQDPEIVQDHLYFMNQTARKNKMPGVGEFKSLVFKQKQEGERKKDETRKDDDRKVLFKQDNGMKVTGITRDGKEEDLTPAGKYKEGGHQLLLQACMSQRLLDMIDPGRHKGTTLANRDALHYTTEDVKTGLPKDRGLVLFDTEESLEKIIADAKAGGRLPLIIATRNKEADAGEHAPHLEWNETNHIITIRDYVPPANGAKTGGRIVTDDQFGRGYDRRNITAAELFGMTIGEK